MGRHLGIHRSGKGLGQAVGTSYAVGSQFKSRAFEIPAHQNSASLPTLQAKMVTARRIPKPQTLVESFSQSMAIQRKMTIGQPNDHYEQEADRVAEQVVNQIDPVKPTSVQRTGQEDEVQTKAEISRLQRLGDEDEEMQTKAEISRLQRLGDEDEEMQTKLQVDAVQRAPEMEDKDKVLRKEEEIGEAVMGGTASAQLESAINSSRGGGQPLPVSLQREMGAAMGADFSGVRVHTGSSSDQMNRSVQSKAFTTGQDIHFKSGEYDPSSKEGQKLLAHELTHVVQQNGDAVRRKK